MNTTLSTTTGRHRHPPDAERFVHVETLETLEAPPGVRSVHLLDRIALHVGIALISRGRRRSAESRERLAHLHEQQVARLERERLNERLNERMLRLAGPLR